MKTQELHSNQSKLVNDIVMRDSLNEFISSADFNILCGLGYLMLDKNWKESELEMDLGSDAIETLLDETGSMDYEKLKGVYTHLKTQKLIK
jgi:spore coat polysaccharide biosynthesis predicted glycosyltransferase SpsG